MNTPSPRRAGWILLSAAAAAAVAGVMWMGLRGRGVAPERAATGPASAPAATAAGAGRTSAAVRAPTPAAASLAVAAASAQTAAQSAADPQKALPLAPADAPPRSFSHAVDPADALDQPMSEADKAFLRKGGVLCNSGRSLFALRRDPAVLVLRNAIIDAAAIEQGAPPVQVPEAFRAAADTKRRLVLLNEPVSEKTRAAVKAAGAVIEHYVPNRGYALTASDEAVAALRSSVGVRYVEPFHPFYKMSSEVQAYLTGTADAQTKQHIEAGKYSVLFFSGDNPAAELEKLGAKVTMEAGTSEERMGNVTCGPDLLASVVKADSVKWVQARVSPKLMNDLAKITTRVPGVLFGRSQFSEPTLNGEGVVVCINDTGIDDRHPGFAVDPSQGSQYPNQNTRVISYQMAPNAILADGLIGDTVGHGTHVSGSVLGNGAWSDHVIKAPGSGDAPYTNRQFAGMAPAAKLVMFEGLVDVVGETAYRDDIMSMTRTAYEAGARLMNNSWGANVWDYGIESKIWDEVVRDANPNMLGNQPLIVFFSAGNSGSGGDDGTGGFAPTIGMPANAKNVITVGAAEQLRKANNLPGSVEMTDTDWQIASYSSRGPTPDGRVKPDIVAPGSYIMSAQTRSVDMDHVAFPDNVAWDYRHGNLDSGSNYAAECGTSMASPVAMGTAAVMFQWYTNRYGVAPSPAMVKALLVNGGAEVSPWNYDFLDPYRALVSDGWGMIDLYRSIRGPDSRQTDEMRLEDEVNAIDGTGLTNQFVYLVPEGQEGGLKITLAWSDFPATPGVGTVQQNDLDLVVTAPDGKVYVGNLMGKRGWGASSIPLAGYNPLAGDRLNNVENVIIPYTVAGPYVIAVGGYQVPHPSQRYALVLAKGVSGIGTSPGGVGGDQAAVNGDIAFHSDGSPVMVYSGLGGVYGGNDYQIFVRKWVGSFGDGSQWGTWQMLDNKWHYHAVGDIEKEAISASVLGSASYEPSVAINPSNDYVYVAWRQTQWDAALKESVYLRYFDGTAWRQLGGSYQDSGISGDTPQFDAKAPAVAIAGDGQPIVAYVHPSPRAVSPFVSQDVRVKKWYPALDAWRGMDGSTNGAIPLADSLGRMDVDVAIDSSGRPVVAWSDTIAARIKCYRWTGAAWSQVGADIGTALSATKPKLACDAAGGIYISWFQSANPGGGETYSSVRAAYSSGGGWTTLGGSMTYPGIPGSTNPAPANAAIGYHGNKVLVAWDAGTNVGNYVFCKMWNGTVWTNVGGAGGPPGVVKLGATTTLNALDVNLYDLPVVVVENDRSGSVEMDAFGVVGHTGPPPFAGLRTAVGNASNAVALGWIPVPDPGGPVTYRAFRTPGTGWDPAATNIPPATDAAAIAAVFGNPITNVQDVAGCVISNMTADRVWYWGVRAINSGGFMDSNRIIRLAGPYDLFGDADRDWLPANEEQRIGTIPVIPDSDGDGMWDGWEWFYSASNNAASLVTGVPRHTNSIALSPLDPGRWGAGGTNLGSGTVGMGKFDDPDGDGMLNIEEFQYWRDHAGTGVWSLAKAANPTNWWLNPTQKDTDGDGMPDGWEYVNQLDPGSYADRFSDADGDGLTNWEEYAWLTDPNVRDSDYDGRTDGQEVRLDNTYPGSPDTDQDGLDDGAEQATGGNPLDQDSNNNDIPDGQEYQLGYTNVGANNLVAYFLTDRNGRLLVETCETTSYTNWLRSINKVYWHRTLTEPKSQTAPLGTAVPIEPLYKHSTNHAFRFANDVADGTNLNATYHNNGKTVEGELISPPFDANSNRVVNLYVSWNEYYETEANWDVCELFASRDGAVNWTAIRPDASGLTTGWVHRVGDLSAFALDTNVTIRFRFKAKNIINNYFKGWWVDDIKIYGGSRIQGTVRDLNGAPIKGAKVMAIGRTMTNVVHGHAYEFPGAVYGETEAGSDGQYSIDGLFLGNYYAKARGSGYRPEFWNGVLYTNAQFYTAFGRQQNPGVYNLSQATGGLLGLTNWQTSARCDYELGRGAGSGRIGIILTNRPSRVYLGQFSTNEMVWNGLTNAPGDPTVRWTPYMTTNGAAGVNDPDYETNAVLPALLDNVAPGTHEPWLSPGWTNMPRVSRLLMPVRDGEATRVTVRTNQVPVRLDVRASKAGYRIMLDGVDTGRTTPGGDEAVTFDVLEGDHLVTLVSPVERKWIAPKQITIPLASRGTVWFSANETDGGKGGTLVRTVDIFNRPISNATVYVNGLPIASNDVSTASLTTPVTISNLVVGLHWFTVAKDGYRTQPPQPMGVNTGVLAELIVTLSEADADYDRVGDALEMEGYTNVFLYSGRDDPDKDGLTSALEFDTYLQFGMRMGVFDADSDDDEMADGEEMGFDGNTNSYGISSLATNAAYDDGGIGVWFVGRFLEGVSGLPLPGQISTNGACVSVKGDQVVATTNTIWWREGRFGTPVIFYGLRMFGTDEEILNASYLAGTEVYTDTYSDRKDTDGDGMWDGWEYMFSERTLGVPRTNVFTASPTVITFNDAGLNAINAADTKSDPDFDGLENLKEFIGYDLIPNTNDWTRPDAPDTDGDLMPDGWEMEHRLDPRDAANAGQDPDNDELTNLGEWLAGTDPRMADTDGDLISDGKEVNWYGTDPTILDTDLDGIIDGWEVIDSDGNPANGLDGGFFPGWNGADMDEDGFADGPTDWDTDGDGMPDGFEVMDAYGNPRPVGQRLNPSDPSDAPLDPDGDGLSNLEEYLIRDGKAGLSPNAFLGESPVFGETGGVVVVEMESVAPMDDWVFEQAYPGYTGTGYFTYKAAADRLSPLMIFSMVPTYYVEINWAGTYTFEVRHQHVDPNPALENACWVRLDGGEWRYTESQLSVNSWVFNTVQYDAFMTPVPNQYDLSAGRHYFEIAGALTNNSLDRFHLYRPPVAAPSAATAESPIVGYVPAAQFIWDYPTDPFSPDSDNDGMPDGFEAWYGLHPMDPIPSPESALGFIIRYRPLWLFADLDGDGVENRNEYDYRFVLDGNARSNAVQGSLHPWFRDTDSDGLIDGDEIKSHRSNPLQQDTDQDGLSDGQGVSNYLGEVNTDMASADHMDRALNDVWALFPRPLADGLAVWVQLWQDQQVLYTDVYSENTNKYVLLEAENLPFYDTNTVPRVTVVPPNWWYNLTAGEINLMYLSFPGTPYGNGDAADGPDQLLYYRVFIQTAGIYTFRARTWYLAPAIPDPADPYFDTSYWLRLDSSPWRKITVDDSGMTRASMWQWYTKEVISQGAGTPEGFLVDMTLPLTAGIHTLAISGRSFGLMIDKIALHMDGVDVTAPAVVASPAIAVAPLTPSRRWGGEADIVQYNIVDDENHRGVYVGGLVYGNAVKDQLLLPCNTFILFGGRNGMERFNEIWELKGLSLWNLEWTGILDGILPVATGEPVAATRLENVTQIGLPVDHPTKPGRPRPGSGRGYPYYDGDKGHDSPEEAIWGEAGVFNSSRTSFLHGWDANYVYYGGNAHDEVEYYTHTYVRDIPPYYIPADDSVSIIYQWGSMSDAYQTNYYRAPVIPQSGTMRVWIGANGTTTSDLYYTGVNMGPVLNTRYDAAGNAAASVVAFLEMVAASAVTNEFDVAVKGELHIATDGSSVENPQTHSVLTSPTDYGLVAATIPNNWPSRRQITNPLVPEWAFNTTSTVVTIPAANIGDIVRINVTPQVRQLLLATFPGTPPATWELGCNMGFVLSGITNSPGLFSFWHKTARLRIQISEPAWRRNASEIWIPLIPQVLPHRRKSSAEAYDYGNALWTIFGGVDGNRVLDDTWVSPDALTWTIRYPDHRPPARWGHGMVYGQTGILVFGGFDKRNQPLNDLWLWDGADWTEINVFADAGDGTVTYVRDRPPPRGGMAFGTYWGGIPVVFGGTDGKRYFNDTWILQEAGFATVGDTNEVPTISPGWRWINAVPYGEMAHPFNSGASPVGRAYPYVGPDYIIKRPRPMLTMLMFGGRVGTLPTAEDTDQDWISDGVERDLGGPAYGRDPRANALVIASAALNTNAAEQVPYAYKMLGGMVMTLFGPQRFSYIADFESLWHPHLLSRGDPEFVQAIDSGFPGEGKRTPPPTALWTETGYDAMIPQSYNLWWHQFGGTPPEDPRDEWELGSPGGTGGDNTAPRYAWSGRWCYGTDLDGAYENNTIAELYSPLLNLSVPDPLSSSPTPNTNDWYLVFHEWLDLADKNDYVWIDAVRPNRDPNGNIGADILLRKSGTQPPRPLINVLPPRNNAYNTTNEWRQVIVPITLKQPDIFFKFVLQSDTAGTAGGWYIDDVALLQAGHLVGTYSGPGNIKLYGINGTNALNNATPHEGVFYFALLPSGEYRLVAGDGSQALGTVAGGDGTWTLTVPDLAINEIVVGISINSPALIQWNSVPGGMYEVQFATPESIMTDTPWSTLGTTTATSSRSSMTDYESETAPARFYRVVFRGME